MRKFKVGDIVRVGIGWEDRPLVNECLKLDVDYVVLKVNTSTGGVIVAEKDDPEERWIRHPYGGNWSRRVFRLATRDVEVIRYKL